VLLAPIADGSAITLACLRRTNGRWVVERRSVKRKKR
jgi:hypothetical protein